MINHNSNYNNTLSPKEEFTGRKSDYKIDLRISFGEIAEVISKTTDNSLTERSLTCIALTPTGNSNGSVKFFSDCIGSYEKI